MLIVGLTGGIASGKSTVSQLLQAKGVAVVDADEAYRKVTQPGSSTLKKLAAEFGPEVICENGSLNRPVLGKMVFSDDEKRRKLNRITHPAVRWQMLKEVAYHFFTGRRVVVMDVPLLYETGVMLKVVGKVICVYCNPEQELERLMRRNALTREDAEARIKAQMSLEEKCRRADVVIDNTSTLERLEESVDDVVRTHLLPSVFEAHKYPLMLIGSLLAARWAIPRLIGRAVPA
eukprot:comp19884_c1_seq1/m.24056 comp19884_c1_seq1/g.24056  ORF comp19884_c1_seq1/g.24056 comp19884_c1_seq1/m.24056 type:complete len:233 (-) comp19884_c1_seq1:57-755(-)